MEQEVTSLKAAIVTMERRQAHVVKAAVKVSGWVHLTKGFEGSLPYPWARSRRFLILAGRIGWSRGVVGYLMCRSNGTW